MMKKGNILFFLAAIIIVTAVASLAYFQKYYHPATKYISKEKEIAPSLSIPHDKMVITTTKGNVMINNVYQNPIQVANSNVLLKDTPDYQIVYISNPQSFVISIIGKNIMSAREKAEQNFLEILGIDKDQACLLNVSLGVDKSVSEKAAGINYGLSFCSSGKPFLEN